jgi:DHA1 family tetracycline resistance protein-like MFS transporter
VAFPENGRTMRRRARPRAYIEPWYFAYALLGVTVVGGIPILFPLKAALAGSPSYVGIVMGAFNLGSAVAPLCGGLADRYRLHRLLLAAGMVVTGAAVLAFAVVSQTLALTWLALLAGTGAAAATTIPYLLIVEAHPEAEWALRIGSLQTLYGAGQVAGLVVSGIMSRADLRGGLVLEGGLAMAAAVPAWLCSRTPPRQAAAASVSAGAVNTLPRNGRSVALLPASRVEPGPGNMHRHFHLGRPGIFRDLRRVLASPFGVFLLAWVLAFAGSAAYFTVYPVLMARTFRIDSGTSSLAYAAAVAISLLLYGPAGAWTKRAGSAAMVRRGFIIRLGCLVALSALAAGHLAGRGLLAEAAFAAFVGAWAILSVSGTALAAERSPVGEGGGMGLFNAASAVAGVLGAVFAGWAAAAWGYGAVPLVGAACVACGLAVTAANGKKRMRRITTAFRS